MSANIYPGRARVFALQKRGTLPNQGEFWTIHQDYTRDIAAAIQFRTLDQASAWITRNHHLRGALRIVEVWIPSNDQPQTSNNKRGAP
jgi:hypothetical protein